MSTVKSALVVDDHPLVSKGIASLLLASCGFQQVDVCSGSQQFWEKLEQSPLPALVILDFWLLEGASLSLIEVFKTRHPLIPLLVMSGYDHPSLQNKIRLAGANGFVHKQESPDVFAQVVFSLLNGNERFSDPQSTRVPQKNELPITASELGLTPRQAEVLALVLQGLPNKRIAVALALSEPTIKEHISALLEKLGMRNRVEIIAKFGGRSLEIDVHAR